MQYFVDCTFVYNNTDDSLYNITLTYKYEYECFGMDLPLGLITLSFIFTPGLLFVYHIRRGLLKSRFTHSLIMVLSLLIVATFPLLNFVVRVNIVKLFSIYVSVSFCMFPSCSLIRYRGVNSFLKLGG